MGLFNLVLLQPLLNILLVLTNVLFSNFGLGIIALTILIRLVMAPLTVWQLRGSKKQSLAMAAMKPKIDQLKKKYAKNPQKQLQEQQKLMKEAGMSPMGCLSSPMLLSSVIQLPIYWGLYRAIIQALAATPQDFMALSQSLYSWPMASEGLPISGQFLWLNLAHNGDPYFILPVLVGATAWLSQKMMTPPTSDPQQQSTQRMMQIMFPLMFAFLTITFPAGLGLYWLVSQVISIIIQYFIFGWGNVFAKAPAAEAVSEKNGKSEKPRGGGKHAEPQSEAGKKADKPLWGGLLDRLRPKETDEKNGKDD